ncbi:MAG: D-alanyl-D-alanine carboxypeptidase [Clostridia bacterium]|nr:D-alanyl-D-alanine carboxypeptidase [Clostridia bacterium]
MHFFKYFSCVLIIFTISFFSICCYGYTNDACYVWSSSTTPIKNITINDVDLNNKTRSTANPNFSLKSSSAILIEQSTGQILYEHNIHEQLRPASVTKIMSILLIMEYLDNGKIHLTDTVPCSENAASMGGSQIWLDPRETLTVDEMLKAICVNSANDCVVAMSEFIAGSEDAFVQMMNDKAKELGMNDTTFKNCHGLDEDGHVTSSYDIAVMSRELLSKHPSVTNYTTIWMDTLRDGTSQLSNTNKLIKNYKGSTGLKTGSTSLALYNLSASATRDGFSIIAVIMKAPSTAIRFSEAQMLLDYGFNNFAFKSFGKQNDVLKSIPVTKGVKSCVDVVLKDNCGAVIDKNKLQDIEQNLILDENLSAPVSAGQKVGEFSFSLDGSVISSVDIVAKNDVPKLNLFNMAKRVYYSWVDLLRTS